ncbi:MAG: 3-demethylubiquinone-9 3-O-methyltransferase [Spirochaetes bacterium]|nr:3-demethylubiquinone-9 3-O-methyltransferase [Spirochaetota bacterium]
MTIDNERYFSPDLDWWGDDENNSHAILRHVVNPLRFAYFKRKLESLHPGGFRGKSLLDVGCGGGYLAEEFAKIGLAVSGIDPSPALIDAAGKHAAAQGLAIAYATGYGERLPFDDASFDHVSCCDVLEHVDDVGPVVGDIARVLKPGGVFFFDTVNRTLPSLLFVIKVAQDWKFTAWEAPRIHSWERFVKPAELVRHMERHGMKRAEMRGISPSWNFPAHYLNARKRVKGAISRKEMGLRLKLHESGNTVVSYLGYAVKA